jgi:hypothetical protein
MTCVWTREGAAALDAAVRTDLGLTFAILDARAAAGVIRLIALRRATRAVLLTFTQTRNGTRGTWRHRPATRREILLANPEPSTLGTSRKFRDVRASEILTVSISHSDPFRTYGRYFAVLHQPTCCCDRLRSSAQGGLGETASDHEP